MRNRAVRYIVLIAILASACSRAPATSGDTTASPSPIAPGPTVTPPPASVAVAATPTASLDPEIEQAVTFRRTFGLRFDLAFVIASMTDPAASDDEFGVPVYPDEATKMYADLADQNATIPIVVDYAAAHAAESGGVFIDRDEHVGMVTSLWTGHLAEHAAALARLLDGRVTLVRLVRYSEAELRLLEDRIFADKDWMDAIPAQMQSLGVGILENAVTMSVSSAEPTAVQQIVDHYGLGDKLVVGSDGTGAALIPSGDVKGKVRLRNGKAPGRAADELRLDAIYQPEVPGACGGGDMGYGVMPDGTFTYPCQAGERILVIYGRKDNEDWVELGRTTVTVIAGETVTVTITLTKDP